VGGLPRSRWSVPIRPGTRPCSCPMPGCRRGTGRSSRASVPCPHQPRSQAAPGVRMGSHPGCGDPRAAAAADLRRASSMQQVLDRAMRSTWRRRATPVRLARRTAAVKFRHGIVLGRTRKDHGVRRGARDRAVAMRWRLGCQPPSPPIFGRWPRASIYDRCPAVVATASARADSAGAPVAPGGSRRAGNGCTCRSTALDGDIAPGQAAGRQARAPVACACSWTRCRLRGSLAPTTRSSTSRGASGVGSASRGLTNVPSLRR
jgi:hypothetical protein